MAATGWSRCSPRSWTASPAPRRRSRTGKLLEHFGRDRLRLDLARVGGIAADPDARLERFDRERTVFGQMMGDVEAGALRLGHRGFDGDVVAETAGDEKARAR